MSFAPQTFLAAARRTALAAVTALLLTAPSASARQCEVALVLALDASSSVDASEFRLQSDGLAAALLDEEVRATILDTRGVLMTAYEWSGQRRQIIIADWTMLDSEHSIAAFAAKLSGHPRVFTEFPTAIGYALGFGAVRLARAPAACVRKIIDMSGDGVHNDGFPPDSAFRAFNFVGVTVNGLVIKGADPDPEPYYRDKVLFGPGAFLEIAGSYEDYASAMKRKLLREIGGSVISDASGR